MNAEKIRLRRNIRLLFAIDFFSNSLFTLPINVIFGKEFLGVSYFEAGSLVFVNRLTSVLFDFLGGIVADRVGRKEANMIGLAIQAASLVPFLLTKSYPLLLLSMAISGIGLALSSNSIDALIYEEAAQSGNEGDYQRANSSTWAFVYAGRFYASIIGGLTFLINPRLPYLLLLIALVIAGIACSQLQIKQRIDSLPTGSYKELIGRTFGVYKSNPRLIKFIVIAGLFSFWGNMLFAYYQPFFSGLGVSGGKLGVVFALIAFGSAMGALVMRKLPNRASGERILSIQLIGLAVTALLLLKLSLPVTLMVPTILSVMSGLFYANVRLFVNREVPNSVRTASSSFATTILNLGLVAGLAASYLMADYLNPTIIFSVIILGACITLAVNQLVIIQPRIPADTLNEA